MTTTPPAFWIERNAAFGAWLRQAPQRVGPRLTSPPPPSALLSLVVDDGPGAAARLGLYHQQVWQRLCSTLQDRWPRTTSVMGAARFNELALAVLQQHASSHPDLDEVAPQLFATLCATADAACAPAQGRSPLRQAILLDEAVYRAWRAPAPARATLPDPLDIATLVDARARGARGLSIVRVEWDLPSPTSPLSPTSPPTTTPPTPLRLTTPTHHVVARDPDGGVTTTIVDTVSARLLSSMLRGTIGEARAGIVSALPRSTSPIAVDRLLSQLIIQACTRGWWVELVHGAPRRVDTNTESTTSTTSSLTRDV